MRASIRCCLALALIFSFSTAAYAVELKTYISGNIGVAFLDDENATDPAIGTRLLKVEYDPGFFLGLAIGHEIQGTNFRVEGEIGYQKNNIDSVSLSGTSLSVSGDQEMRMITLLFNLYYDFKNSSAFTPYIGGGLGLGNMKIEGASSSDGDAVNGYQYSTGVTYRISDRIALDLQIRHLETSMGQFETTRIDFATNNAIFSMRGYF